MYLSGLLVCIMVMVFVECYYYINFSLLVVCLVYIINCIKL